MKKALIVIAVYMLLLCGCTQPEVVVEMNTQVTLGETELTLPFKVEDMERAGFTLAFCEVEEVTHGGENVAYFEDSQGRAVMVNLGTLDEFSSIEDSWVVDILADNTISADVPLVVKGDIKIGDTEEKVIECYGESLLTQDTMALYFDTDSEGMYGTYVVTQDGIVVRVEVMYTVGFVDYIEEVETDGR